MLHHFGLLDCFDKLIRGETMVRRNRLPAPLLAAAGLPSSLATPLWTVILWCGRVCRFCLIKGHRSSPVTSLPNGAHFAGFGPLPEKGAQLGVLT